MLRVANACFASLLVLTSAVAASVAVSNRSGYSADQPNQSSERVMTSTDIVFSPARVGKPAIPVGVSPFNALGRREVSEYQQRYDLNVGPAARVVGCIGNGCGEIQTAPHVTTAARALGKDKKCKDKKKGKPDDEECELRDDDGCCIEDGDGSSNEAKTEEGGGDRDSDSADEASSESDNNSDKKRTSDSDEKQSEDDSSENDDDDDKEKKVRLYLPTCLHDFLSTRWAHMCLLFQYNSCFILYIQEAEAAENAKKKKEAEAEAETKKQREVSTSIIDRLALTLYSFSDLDLLISYYFISAQEEEAREKAKAKEAKKKAEAEAKAKKKKVRYRVGLYT